MSTAGYQPPEFDRTPAPKWLAPVLVVSLLALWGLLIGKTFPFSIDAEWVVAWGNPTRSGDFPHFFLAAKAALEGENIYTSWTGGYVYPPLLAAALTPTIPLGMQLAAQLWYVLIFGLLAFTGWWTIAEFARRFRIPLDFEARLIALLLATLALVDCFRPMLDLAQTDSIMLLGFVAPLLLTGRGEHFDDKPSARPRPWLAGLLIALALHIKFTAIGLLPYYGATRRWTLLAATAVSGVAIALATVPLFGFEKNFEYLWLSTARVGHVVGLPAPSYDVFDPHPIHWDRSRSITSAAVRLTSQTELSKHHAYMAIGAAFLAWLGAAVWIYRLHGVSFVRRLIRPRSIDTGVMRVLLIAEWINVVGAMMALGPQTTKRHTIVIVPGLLLAGLLVVCARSQAARACSAIGLLLIGVGSLFPPSASFVPAEVADIPWLLGACGGFGWTIAAFSLLMIHASLSEWKKRAPRSDLVSATQ